jgi:hypothetical protein
MEADPMHKRPISLAKLRQVPQQFRWVDQRLVRERHIDQLGHAACTPEASALHLTRRGDLLDVRLAPPDLSIYYATPQPSSPTTEEGDHHG